VLNLFDGFLSSCHLKSSQHHLTSSEAFENGSICSSASPLGIQSPPQHGHTGTPNHTGTARDWTKKSYCASMDKNMAVCQNLVPLVNIKIAGKWMFIPLKIVLIGIDPYPYVTVTGTAWEWNSILSHQSQARFEMNAAPQSPVILLR